MMQRQIKLQAGRHLGAKPPVDIVRLAISYPFHCIAHLDLNSVSVCNHIKRIARENHPVRIRMRHVWSNILMLRVIFGSLTAANLDPDQVPRGAMDHVASGLTRT